MSDFKTRPLCPGNAEARQWMEDAAEEIEQLRAENAALASWQCPYKDGKTGLVGDECGNQYCAKKATLDAVRKGHQVRLEKNEKKYNTGWNDAMAYIGQILETNDE